VPAALNGQQYQSQSRSVFSSALSSMRLLKEAQPSALKVQDSIPRLPGNLRFSNFPLKRNKLCKWNASSPKIQQSSNLSFLRILSSKPLRSKKISASGVLRSATVALVSWWEKIKLSSRLYGKRHRHRQSGLLQLGQTARPTNANMMLVVISFSGDKTVSKKAEMSKS